MVNHILEIGNMLYLIIGAATGFLTAFAPIIYYGTKFLKRQDEIEKSYLQLKQTMIANLSCELTKLHYKAKERGYKYRWEDETFKRSYKEYAETDRKSVV